MTTNIDQHAYDFAMNREVLMPGKINEAFMCKFPGVNSSVFILRDQAVWCLQRRLRIVKSVEQESSLEVAVEQMDI